MINFFIKITLMCRPRLYDMCDGHNPIALYFALRFIFNLNGNLLAQISHIKLVCLMDISVSQLHN